MIVDMPLMILQKIQEAILFADICGILWLSAIEVKRG